MDTDALQIRIHGRSSLPTLIYLPGIHGDWTLVSSFRERLRDKVRFVEFTYPRTIDWSLEDYAHGVLEVLVDHGIRQGVVVGESFGSQVAWAMLPRCQPHNQGRFEPRMLILAGGFVRYPFVPLVDFTRVVWAVAPAWTVRSFFRGYAVFARWRHRHAPETAGAIKEFVARRTAPDLAAMSHRLKLIREADPGESARRAELPVYQLAGFWDPIVYYPAVRAWLRRYCSGYRETCVLPAADHNVLGTAPEQAAEVVLRWLRMHARRRDERPVPELLE